MACFTAPVAEAIVTTVVKKAVSKKENKNAAVPFSRKLGWLNKMLWGGSALLAFEHVWHGEIVPWFPFLTAASDPQAAKEMLMEIATRGVTMAVLITAVWGCMVGVSAVIERRGAKEADKA